ncbi:carbohydrate kinase [Cellulosimicrobium cellulans]|uniref:PfkB family carbohydrate kinase n=1 Tax=Cellulosimicrobium cellulans TaxID=1710 RepID=UPI001964B90F|nr:PfkB family carbohydrate kinase [Cellulosimicrobium cellulans]MBN0040179.1 carbohydrate kinase [Cellulosimicrobium cellulans]
MLVCCGLVTLDVVQVVDALPRPDEKIVARSVSATFGGPAANAAATAVALGVPTRLVTAVGDGPFAELVRRELADCGVEVVDAADGTTGGRLAVSTVLVTRATGERAVVSTNASGFGDLAVRAATGGRGLLDGVGPSDVVLLDGHLPGLALTVAREARERGAAVVLDGGSWKPDAAEMIGSCDAVVVSADFRPPGIEARDVLAAVAALGPRFVARTRGPRPVEVLDAGERYDVVVPRPERVVDTLGAGDVVHGAFAAAAARGASWRVALEQAVVVASRSVAHPGARGWAGAAGSPP